MIQPANRVTEIQEYYFSRKLKEVAQLNAEGKDIISLAIGSPDMPPSKQTIDKLCEVAQKSDTHGYQPTVGIPELRKAMAEFYKRWYDVDLTFDNLTRYRQSIDAITPLVKKIKVLGEYEERE